MSYVHYLKRNKFLPKWAQDNLEKLSSYGYDQALANFENGILTVKIGIGVKPLTITAKTIVTSNPKSFWCNGQGYLFTCGQLWEYEQGYNNKVLTFRSITTGKFLHWSNFTKSAKFNKKTNKLDHSIKFVGLWSKWINPLPAF